MKTILTYWYIWAAVILVIGIIVGKNFDRWFGTTASGESRLAFLGNGPAEIFPCGCVGDCVAACNGIEAPHKGCCSPTT